MVHGLVMRGLVNVMATDQQQPTAIAIATATATATATAVVGLHAASYQHYVVPTLQYWYCYRYRHDTRGSEGLAASHLEERAGCAACLHRRYPPSEQSACVV
jgi:hypothetical protein